MREAHMFGVDKMNGNLLPIVQKMHAQAHLNASMRASPTVSQSYHQLACTCNANVRTAGLGPMLHHAITIWLLPMVIRPPLP